jgi:hypothetical protein
MANALANWREKFARENETIEPEELEPFCGAVLTGVQSQIGQLPLSIDEEPEDLDNLLKAIKQVRKRFIISYVDKFSSKFMFTCPKFYAQSLLNEFMPWKLDASINPNDDDQTYETTEEVSESIIQRHSDFLEVENINEIAFDKKKQNDEEEVASELAYPCAAGKFHKTPMKWRYIACSTRYSLRALSIWISKSFKGLMPIVHDMWCSKTEEIGFHSDKSWIVENSASVPSLITHCNQNTASALRDQVVMRTYDFSKMYTNIQLDDLKNKLSILIDQLFTFKRSTGRERFLSVPRDGSKESTWKRHSFNDSGKHKCVDANKLKRWVNYLVDNIYLSFGDDKVLRQRIGIPMGTNCAVFVANLFCFAYEYDFLVQLVDANRLDLVTKFSGTARYIDDLFCVDNDMFSQYLYISQTDVQGLHGIYPDFLTLNCEQESRDEVSFLDISVFRDGNVWCTKTYDKREHLPLSRIDQKKYPHPTSFLSVRSKFGIITSRMSCFGRVNRRKKDFIERTRRFLKEFRDRGYQLNEIRRFAGKFLKRNPLHFTVNGVLGKLFKDIL